MPRVEMEPWQPGCILQAEHPLLWGTDEVGWLKGSPMSKKLASRAKQVQQDAQALIEAGANGLFASADDAEPLVSDLTAKWVAATLLSRAFNLEIPTQNLNGVLCFHCSRRSAVSAATIPSWSDWRLVDATRVHTYPLQMKGPFTDRSDCGSKV